MNIVLTQYRIKIIIKYLICITQKINIFHKSSLSLVPKFSSDVNYFENVTHKWNKITLLLNYRNNAEYT